MFVPSWNVAPRARSAPAIRIAFAVLTTVASVGSAWAQQSPGRPNSVARGSSVLSDADVALVARLLEVADTRRRDTVVIDHALASPSSYIRSLGTRVIGQNAISARVSAVRSLVSDADTAVAADAAFALGMLRDTSAVEVLASALALSPTIVDAAAWSLGEVGSAGRPVLERVLTSGQPRAALAVALQASAKLRPVPAGLITSYLEDSDIEVRRSAAYAVTRSRVPASARSLIASANVPSRHDSTDDRNTDLWSYVARGLGQPATGDSLGEAAQAVLVRLALHSQPHVRINALRSLATYGPSMRVFFLSRLRDPDANARIALAQSLGEVLRGSAEDWTNAWQSDTGFTFRRAVLSGALRAGVRLSALDSANAAAWTRHTDWRHRAAAAQAASAGTAADIDAIVTPLLRDSDPRVRAAAWGAAVARADSANSSGKPYARAALSAALTDSDLFVRATVLDGMRTRAQAADASVALRSWHFAMRDPENDARVAALRVIGVAWRNDSASFSRALRDSLAAARAPADPVERGAGRAAGPFGHWQEAAPPARPASWYLQQARTFVLPDLAGRPTRATIATSRGAIQIRFFGADAPLTVANFVRLARRGYYNGLLFHRVVPNFVAQDGDPRGDGSGGPGYAIRDELNRRWYDRGAVGMALSGPDTGGSQYFLSHSPQPHLDGHYTVFGHVIAGYDALDAIVQGDRIVTVTIR